MKSIKIVADSSCDMHGLCGADFETAPLKIITADKEFIDDKSLDVLSMVNYLQSYKGKSSTSCPNTEDWLSAFGEAEEIYCVTITGTLSGSYNAAVLAKNSYEEMHPERRVFVLNSLTAGPEISLIIEKIKELINDGKPFDEVCKETTAYSKKTGLLFMLESMKNLANNGRVSPITAKMAGILGIRVVGKASSKGDLEPLNKCRGEKKALEAIFSHMKDLGFKGGKVKIAHCFNENVGKELKQKIKEKFAEAKVELYSCGGLCSFYAEKGGLLVGFEKA